MSNTIRKIYDNDNADVSVGIMIDMKAKTETFVIGSSADLILWAESGFSENQTGSLIRHTNEIGSVIKNINNLSVSAVKQTLSLPIMNVQAILRFTVQKITMLCLKALRIIMSTAATLICFSTLLL